MAIPCRYRGFALILAVLAWTGVLLQLGLTLRNAAAAGESVWHGVVMYLGYFTVLTNIVAALTVTVSLLVAGSALGRFFGRPGVVTAIATAIALVGVAYFLLLRETWNPRGGQLVADVLLHYVVPALFVAYWWLAVPKGGLRYGSALVWASYPLTYFAYMLARGEISGLYPYPFADVSSLGYPRTLANSLLILIAFLVGGLAMIRIGRLQRTESLDSVS